MDTDVLRLRQSTRTDMRRLWNDCHVVVSLGGEVIVSFGGGSDSCGDMQAVTTMIIIGLCSRGLA